MAAEATGAAASVVARSSAGSAPAAAAVRHIFLTGQPGVGKTTLVRTIFEKLLNANPEVAKASQVKAQAARNQRGRGVELSVVHQ